MPRRADQDLRRQEGATVRERFAAERRRQVLSLLLLAAALLIGSVLRAGIHNVFLPGWWRLW